MTFDDLAETTRRVFASLSAFAVSAWAPPMDDPALLSADQIRTAIEVTVPGDVSTADAPGRYAAVGVTRLIVRPWAKSIEAIDGIRRFAAEFIPPAEESPAGRAERPSAGISGL